MKLLVTVVIPTKDEEANLPKCLAGLSQFSEVIVVDSGSSDRTIDIALDFGAKVTKFCWDGHYPKKRNWSLLTLKFENEWILFLDADEIVSNEFCAELEAALVSNQHNGFWLNYTNHFLGRRLNYGVPQRKLALFRRGRGFYERIDEDHWSSLDMEIHEHPVVEGSVGELQARIDHNDFRGLTKFLQRHLSYAKWESKRYLEFSRTSKKINWTWRQRIKYRHLTFWWYPWAYFFFTFVLRFGFLDGGAGFHYAFFKAWYFNTIRLLIREELSGCGTPNIPRLTDDSHVAARQPGNPVPARSEH